MDYGHAYTVKWDVDEENGEIVFHLFVKTLGWIGFGLR